MKPGDGLIASTNWDACKTCLWHVTGECKNGELEFEYDSILEGFICTSYESVDNE